MQSDLRTRSGNILRPAECDDDGNMYVSLASGGLIEACLAGRLFSACNTAVVATTAGTTGTWTGLCVSNLTGSGKNFIFHEFQYGVLAVATAEGSVGLQICTIAAPAAIITPANQFRGSSNASVAYVDDGATIVGGLAIRICASITHGAATVSYPSTPCHYPIKGSIILAPGYTLASYTDAAQAAAMQFGFLWEEVDA